MGIKENRMKESQNVRPEIHLQAAYWGERRLVVIDVSAQPANPDYLAIYSVHGHDLRIRSRSADWDKLNFSVPTEEYRFALEQYFLWLEANPGRTEALLSRDVLIPEAMPHPRRKCPECDGQGTWMDRVNKCSYGVMEEEGNVVERCSTCRGSCYVDDFL